MINPQEAINRELIQGLAGLSKQLANLTMVVQELKRRQALMDRMASLHHFTLLDIVSEPGISEGTRERLRELAKKLQIKLDPRQPKDDVNGNERNPG